MAASGGQSVKQSVHSQPKAYQEKCENLQNSKYSQLENYHLFLFWPLLFSVLEPIDACLRFCGIRSLIVCALCVRNVLLVLPTPNATLVYRSTDKKKEKKSIIDGFFVERFLSFTEDDNNYKIILIPTNMCAASPQRW